MGDVSLSMGCGDYDRTRALFDGTVRAEGIDLTWEPVNVPHELFVRVLKGEFDAAEMSLSGFTSGIGRGSRELIAIPVFTSRLFRHGFIWVNPASGITSPQALAGRRVGVPDYTITAAVWIRGLLQHEYGVAPDQMRWRLGGLDKPGGIVPLGQRLPASVQIEPIPESTSLIQMLEQGELDAIVSASIPRAFLQGAPYVQRLIPNYQEVEAAYFRRTGIVPIMHVVVLRRSVYEQDPWIATSLYRALCESKQIAYHRLSETGAPRATLIWLQAHLDAERAVFGEDYWPYGVEPNRKTLEAFVTYMYDQGLTERRVPVEDLFAPETLGLD